MTRDSFYVVVISILLGIILTSHMKAMNQDKSLSNASVVSECKNIDTKLDRDYLASLAKEIIEQTKSINNHNINNQSTLSEDIIEKMQEPETAPETASESQETASSSVTRIYDFSEKIYNKNQKFIAIPTDLLLSKSNIIWKIKSNLTKTQCDKMWRFADNSKDWKSYSSFGDALPSEDFSINKLSYDVGFPLENLITGLSNIIEEKFMNVEMIPWTNRDFQSNHMKKDAIDYQELIRLKGPPFIIRYDVDKIPSMGRHKDNSDVSFIMLLNNPKSFEGGGTYFPIINKTVFLEQGELVLFNGQLVHEGLPVTKGKRFILSGFVKFSDDYVNMKRYQSLSTLGYLH